MKLLVLPFLLLCILAFNRLHRHLLYQDPQGIFVTDNVTVTRELNYSVNAAFASYKKRSYTQFIEAPVFFHHLQDEKALMLGELTNLFVDSEDCQSDEDILSFFQRHKSEFYKECEDFREFSHCQPHYLFQFDMKLQKCHSYFHEKYSKKNYTGITMTMPLSADRLDRLPLHLNQWKGRMSIAIQLKEEELETVLETVSELPLRSIRFTFYVVEKKESNRCVHVSMNRTLVQYETCYAINVLRNLAIETIRTTHFMVIDGDGILTSTFEKHVTEFIPLLSDSREVLLFPLIPYELPGKDKCIEEGDCQEAWSKLPKTKKELLQNETAIEEIRPYYLFFNFTEWKKVKKNVLIEFIPPKAMEPYGIFKRTRSLPLFHPYFINYGSNKVQFYHVLNTMDYHYNVMALDFCVDLPHPLSTFKDIVRNGPNRVYADQLTAYFNKMINAYCERYVCRYHMKQYVNKTALRQ